MTFAHATFPTLAELVMRLPEEMRKRQSVASDETFALWLKCGGDKTLMEFVQMLNPTSTTE